MKRAYAILLVAVSVIVLSWFLPWLYSLMFPVSGNDPFVAYSPVVDKMIVSQSADDKGDMSIFAVGEDGEPEPGNYTREQRDSLLPQIYYTQLIARNQMPDSIGGREVSVAIFKHSQWVFSSSPRDINKVMPEVYLIMESMPVRIDLEDPSEVFRFRDGGVEFIDIATNQPIAGKSRRFTEIFRDRGFEMPVKAFSANITSRKPYDEGYLLVDSNNDLYHMKMQAGRPYMTKVRKDDSIKVAHAFVMENVETRFLGVVTDEADNLYLLERDGYRLRKLDIGKFNPETDRLSIVKNLFNIIVKVSDDNGSRWTAVDSDNLRTLATYSTHYDTPVVAEVGGYIFPFELSFTSVSDCYAKPRFEYWSWRAVYLNVVLALITFVVYRRRKMHPACTVSVSILTLLCGIFSFIPLMILKK